MTSPTSRRNAWRLAQRSTMLGLAAALAATSPGMVEAQGRPMSMIRDAEIEAIIREDADPIFRAAGLVPKNIRIHLIADKELNAFVAQGQQMFLNTGLITRTEDPNQLIGVIAHETGHIAGGHLARQGEGSRSALATYALTFGLGILAAATGADPGAATGLLYSANYFATLQFLSYTRVQEGAADQAAATFLDKAGLSGRGLVSFFDNFRYQEVFSEARRDAYFRSHPLSSDRIENLRQRTEGAPHYEARDSDKAMADHKIMVAKLKAFMNFPQQTFQDYPETDQSYPAKYARAIAHYRNLETEKALRDIDALLTEQPNNPYLWELKGQVLFESGRTVEAEAPQRRAVELAPDAPILRVSLAQTLLALPKDRGVDEALVHAQRALDVENDLPLAWRIMAEAHDRKGEAGLARLATAEQSFSLGQTEAAKAFGTRARELLTKDTPQYRRAVDIINAAENGERRRGRRG